MVERPTRDEWEIANDCGALPGPCTLAEPTLALRERQFAEAAALLRRAIGELWDARRDGVPPAGWVCNPEAAIRLAARQVRGSWAAFATAKTALRRMRVVESWLARAPVTLEAAE